MVEPVPLSSSDIPPYASITTDGPISSATGLPGCPAENDTVYTTTYNDQFQLQCFREFLGGDTLFTVLETTFENCLELCSSTNQGSPSLECYGVASVPTILGVQCFLKAQSGLVTYATFQGAVSAVLLTGVTDIIGAFR